MRRVAVKHSFLVRAAPMAKEQSDMKVNFKGDRKEKKLPQTKGSRKKDVKGKLHPEKMYLASLAEILSSYYT